MPWRVRAAARSAGHPDEYGNPILRQLGVQCVETCEVTDGCPEVVHLLGVGLSLVAHSMYFRAMLWPGEGGRTAARAVPAERAVENGEAEALPGSCRKFVS
eukprot:SAG22_NODE_312_length_12614_cov_4.783540_5_plen_101_part_00